MNRTQATILHNHTSSVRAYDEWQCSAKTTNYTASDSHLTSCFSKTYVTGRIDWL